MHLCPSYNRESILSCRLPDFGHEDFVLFLLLSALVVTVYPRPQVLNNPQMAAAEGKPNAVGRKWMTDVWTNRQNPMIRRCCPYEVCPQPTCPPELYACC